MSSVLWTYIIGGFLILHGLGHLGGLPVYSESWSRHSWLLSGLGGTFTRAVGGLLWTIVAIGFIAAGLGVFGFLVPHEWWRSLAVAAAAGSILVIVLYWDAAPTRIQILAADIFILVALLLPG